MRDTKQPRALIIATQGVEQAELEVPRDKLAAAGVEVVVASPDGQSIRSWDEKDWGRMISVNLRIADAEMDDYDALVIPGGVMNPDKLRVDDSAMKLVKDALAHDKLVAAVCHGPWLLVQADALDGVEATSYPSIRKDLENAGAIWIDKTVVVDKGIITSRNPADLEAFSAAIVGELKERRAEQSAAAE